MAVRNTEGAISNAVAAPEKPKSAINVMSHIINAESTQNIIKASLKENAGAFTASVLDLYNTDKYLQQCNPAQVMGECLKAVSLKLPINKQLGFAYVIAYKGVPTFQLGYKGMIQLCMRTGAYKYINAGEVYEGELQKIDKLTGEVDINGVKTSDKVVGYFAYIETINGFRKAFYWTKEKVISHSQKYSQSYKSGSAIWKDNFTEMATKTVLRNLLGHYGVMSIELEQALTSESDVVKLADQAIKGDIPSAMNDNSVPVEFVEVADSDYVELPVEQAE